LNIFYLHEDPTTCAQQHNDSHSSKMCVEYAQLLSTAHRICDGTMWIGQTATGRNVKRWYLEDPYMNREVYLACHVSHPSALWVRESLANYMWLYKLWIQLGLEYTHRYGRKHESVRKLEDILRYPPMAIDTTKKFTQPTPAMKQYPQCIVEGDSIASYRNYYLEAKQALSKWTKRGEPDWWKEQTRGEW
jgi:hypothetical protein